MIHQKKPKTEQTGIIWEYNQPTFARIIHQIDFDVPRRHSIPSSINERIKLKYTTTEINRYEQAKNLSPRTFHSIATCHLDELDKLVTITTKGIEIPNSPILAIINNYHPITIIIENNNYELITDGNSHSLNKYYLEQFPDTQYWLALRDTKRPRTNPRIHRNFK